MANYNSQYGGDTVKPSVKAQLRNDTGRAGARSAAAAKAAERRGNPNQLSPQYRFDPYASAANVAGAWDAVSSGQQAGASRYAAGTAANTQRQGNALNYLSNQTNSLAGLAGQYNTAYMGNDAAKYGAYQNANASMNNTAMDAYSRAMAASYAPQAQLMSMPWMYQQGVDQQRLSGEAQQNVAGLNAGAQMYGANQMGQSAQNVQALRSASDAYAAQQAAQSNLGVSQNQGEASMYGARAGADASMYGADRNLQAMLAGYGAQNYGADRQAQASMFGSQAGLDANRLGAESQAYAANQAAQASMYGANQAAQAQMGTAHYAPWAQAQSAMAGANAQRDAASVNALAQLRGQQLQDSRQREGLSALLQFATPLMGGVGGYGGMQTNYGAGFTA